MPMEVTRRVSLALLILFAVAITARTVRSQKNATAPAQSSDVERGKYLVNEVAKCQECHTPRDSGGNLDYSRDLQGAPVWIVPVHPDTKWSNRAPAIAGLPGLSDAQAQTILEKGIGPNGLAIQPPMHVYHMNHSDATAIIAYLRSMSSAYPRQ
jgi:mono/diheme cytochrome c family protein